MSDLVTSQPALGAWEFDSIAEGIFVADQIVKGAPVASIHTGTIHPGRYLVVVTGDPASVDVACDIVDADFGDSLTDSLVLPDIARVVVEMLGRAPQPPDESASAIGIVETTTVTSTILAADASVKDAKVQVVSVVLADGLGGKAYFVVSGDVGDVASSVEAGTELAGDRLVKAVVVPQVTDQIRADLVSGSSFARTVGFEETA